MLQSIVTIMIVIAAGTIAMVRFIRFFTNPPDTCGGCHESCGRCSIEEMLRENGRKKNHNQLSRSRYPGHDK